MGTLKRISIYLLYFLVTIGSPEPRKCLTQSKQHMSICYLNEWMNKYVGINVNQQKIV